MHELPQEFNFTEEMTEIQNAQIGRGHQERYKIM